MGYCKKMRESELCKDGAKGHQFALVVVKGPDDPAGQDPAGMLYHIISHATEGPVVVRFGPAGIKKLGDKIWCHT
jgi:hypothetical protein